MTYLKMFIQGGQSSSEAGKEGFFLYERYVASEGQTIAVLKDEYRPGEYELEVHINGVLQTYEIDYYERDSHTIEFIEPLEKDDILLFSVRGVKHNTVLHERQEANDGQTIFTLTNSYHPGRDTLLIFDNGQLLTCGEDYTETDERTVTFNEPFDTTFKHIIVFHEVV